MLLQATVWVSCFLRYDGEITRSNIARPWRACVGREEVNMEVGERVRVHVPSTKECEKRGRVLTATNMVRHMRSCVGRPEAVMLPLLLKTAGKQ